jgi:hypothetical protein
LTQVKNLYANEQTAKGSDRENDDRHHGRPDAIAVWSDRNNGLNGGLIVLGSALANTHRDLIILLTDQHRLTAVYPDRIFVANGGPISYGPDRTDQLQRALLMSIVF